MADRLTVQVKLDTTQAKKNLADLISQMKKAEESGAKFKKSLSTSANVVGDLTKVDKAINGISNESDKAESSIKKLKWSTDTLGSSFDKLGSKFTKAFGSNLQSSLSKSIGFMKQLASTALLVGGAISGVSVGKSFTDYVEFSKSAGTSNAIIGGNAKTQRLLENTFFGATAGTTQTAGQVAEAAQAFISTPMFDPTQGGTIAKNSTQYMKNLKDMGPIMQKVGQFASSQGTTIEDMMNQLILISATTGNNLKDISKGGGLDKSIDYIAALLNSSVGTPSSVIPNIAKFAGNAKSQGVSMDTMGAIFSNLTATYSPEEAGVRTNAMLNWLQSAPKTIGKLKDLDKELHTNLSGDLYNAIYTKDKNGVVQKNDPTQIIEKMFAMLNSTKDADVRDKIMSVLFPEVRQGQGLKAEHQAIGAGSFEAAKRNFAMKQGLGASAIASFTESSGFKIDTFFKGMSTGLQATTGALIDLFSSPDKFDTKSWEDAMNGIGDQLKKNLGEGAAKPIEWLKNLVSYLNSDAGKSFTKNLEDSAEKLAHTIGLLGDAVFNIVTSKEAQNFIDFVGEHPIWSIAIGTVGMDIVKASIQTAVQTAIASGFATPVALSVATIVVGKMVIDFLEDRSKKTIDAAKENEQKAFEQAAKTGNPIDKLKAEQARIAREFAEKQSTAPSALFRDPGAYVRTVGQNIGNFMNYMLPNFIKEDEANRLGIKEPAARKQFIENYGQADWTGLLNSYNKIQNIIDNKMPIPSGVGAQSGIIESSKGLIKNAQDMIGTQDKKVGDGADKLSKTADSFSGVISAMINAAASLDMAGKYLGSIQIANNTGQTNPLAPNSSNKSFIGAAQGSAQAHV